MPPEMTASRLSRAEQVRERRIKLGGLFGILKRCQAPRRPHMSVAPHGSELTPIAKPRADGTLVKALARAWRWQRMLESGEYGTLAELSDAERISRSLRLPCPASDAPRARHRRTDPRRASDGRARAVPAAVPARVGDAARATLLKPVRRCQDRLPLPFSDTGRAGRTYPLCFPQ